MSTLAGRTVMGCGLVAWLWIIPAAASAQDVATDVLLGRSPTAWRGTWQPERVTDGVCALPGDGWNCDQAAVFGLANAWVLYDLGTVRHVAALDFQASAAAGWRVEGSPDGAHWQTLWNAPAVGPSSVLVQRVMPRTVADVRYLRLGFVSGMGPAGVGELRAFTPGTVPPPRVEPGNPPVDLLAEVRAQAWRKSLVALLALVALAFRRRGTAYGVLVPGMLAAVLGGAWTLGTTGLGLAVALSLAAVGIRVATEPSARARVLTARGWGLFVVAAVCAFINFGRFSGGGTWTPHYHDALHYVLGARYAPELGYDRLYQCVVVADAQNNQWPLVLDRPVRELRTNAVVTTGALLQHPDACTARYTPARWRAFRRDVAYFRGVLTPAAFSALLMDHGYNATPVWTWLFRTVGLRTLTVTRDHLALAAGADTVCYAALVPVALWAFGMEGGALALLVLALGFPWFYFWTGGAVGRAPWLLASIGGVGLLRRGRPGLAGVALGTATALQVFPGLMFVGTVVGAVDDWVQTRRVSTERVRVLTGAAGAVAVLGALGATVYPGVYQDFWRNSVKHAVHVSDNRLGLGMALGALPHGVSRVTMVGVLVGYALALRTVRDAWVRMALGVLVPFLVLTPSSYYGALLLVLAPLGALGAVRDGALGQWGEDIRAYGCMALVLGTQVGVAVLHGDAGSGYYAAVSWAVLALGALAVATCRRA